MIMAFDLSELLAGVSNPGTREQIEYFSLEQIEPDPNNFYRLSAIEDLAANIQLCGLQQPLRLRPIPDQDGRYRIVSGHRRRAALELLAKEDPERWDEVACIVENDAASESLQQLRLIYANANTRTVTSAEFSEQAVQVEKLLYQLKEEGYEFPGRMRDHVSQAVGASKTKLARLKVIRENLVFEWKQPWKDNKIGESVAYALAQLPAYWQNLIFAGCSNMSYLYESTVQEYARRFKEIEATACGNKKEFVCGHKSTMMEKSCKDRWQDPCRSRCCLDCPSLRTCKDSCSAAADKKKAAQAKYKADNAELAKQKENADMPKKKQVDSLWKRFGLARELACKEWPDCKKAMGVSYFTLDDQKVMELECGEAKVTPDTKLPYSATRYDVEQLCKLADYLGCSLDYLFCRTDIREIASTDVSDPDTRWKTGKPEAYGTYVAYVQIADVSKKMLRELLWDGEEWFLFGSKIADDTKVCCWMEQPEL